MWKRLTVMLLAALCLLSVAAAQEPVYDSTRAFAELLREAEIPYEAYGVDEDGDDSISVEQDGYTIVCYFGEDGESASFFVWYLIEYAPEREADVMLACSRLNSISNGPGFYADESDCTVTVSLDLVFSRSSAGPVAYRGYCLISEMLPEAREALTPYDISLPREILVPTPSPTPVVTATPQPVVTAPPQPVVTATPQPVVTAPPQPVVTAPPQPVVTATPQPVVTPAPTTAPQSAKMIVITAGTARIRSGPSVTSPYLCTAKRGDVFPCLGVSGSWYIIDCNGRVGFVSMDSSDPQ